MTFFVFMLLGLLQNPETDQVLGSVPLEKNQTAVPYYNIFSTLDLPKT
jgi:hypothetical protein